MSNRYRWYVVIVLTLAAALNYADRAVIAALLPLMRSSLGMSDAMLGALSSFFMVAYALASPATGLIADRLPRVRVIVWSLSVWSVATVLSGCAATAGQMFLTRILLGLSQCAYLPAAVALMADFHPAGRRAFAIGLPLAGCNLGVIVGGFLGGYSGDHFGWRPAFFFLGTFGLVLAAVCVVTLRPIAAAERKPAPGQAAGAPRARFRELFRVPSFLIILLESSCLAASGWCFLAWLPFFFHEKYHLTLTGAALAGTVAYQVSATLGYAIGGYGSDRFAASRRERRMLLQSLCYLVGAPFLLVFATSAGVGVISGAIFVTSLCRALGSANDQVLICEVLPPSLRATAVGLMNGVNIGVGAASVQLAALLLPHLPLAVMFASMTGLFLAAAAVTQLGYRRYLRQDLIAGQ